jgi:putative endonuclease
MNCPGSPSPRCKQLQEQPQTPQELGREGEEAAARLLGQAGLRLLDRNWRYGNLELDIVCRDNDTLVFVEVKTRSSKSRGGPAAAITAAKQRSLCRAACAWLSMHEQWHSPCRFDVICVLRQNGNHHLEHYRHAFDCSMFMGGGNTAWQP